MILTAVLICALATTIGAVEGPEEFTQEHKNCLKTKEEDLNNIAVKVHLNEWTEKRLAVQTNPDASKLIFTGKPKRVIKECGKYAHQVYSTLQNSDCNASEAFTMALVASDPDYLLNNPIIKTAVNRVHSCVSIIQIAEKDASVLRQAGLEVQKLLSNED